MAGFNLWPYAAAAAAAANARRCAVSARAQKSVAIRKSNLIDKVNFSGTDAR